MSNTAYSPTSGTATEPEFVRSATVSEIVNQLNKDKDEKIVYCSLPNLRVIAEGVTDCSEYPLYEPEFLPAFIHSLEWWIDAAARMLLGANYVRPQKCDARDRFVVLEGAFWGAVAPARRQSMDYADCTEDMDDLKPICELARHYLAFRDAVCELGRELLPSSICERLEERV